MSRKSKSSKLERAAIVAAAGIAAAAGLTTAAGAASSTFSATPMTASHEMMSPTFLKVSSRGVTVHSDRLSAALMKNKAGAVKALQALFPGLTTSQVTLGAGGMVTFRGMTQAAFNQAVKPGLNTADNGVCNGGACAAPLLPGEEGFVE